MTAANRPPPLPEKRMPSISLKIYMTPFAEKGATEDQKWSRDAANEALAVANSIWSKANIAFVIADCVMDKPLEMAKSDRTDDRRLLDVLSLRHTPEKLVHLFLISPVQNLPAGGCSYLDSDPEPAGFVQWYGAGVANGRVWAHELGHLLSLDHVDVDYSDQRQAALRSNLMTRGLSVGTDLTAGQIGKAKSSKLINQFQS